MAGEFLQRFFEGRGQLHIKPNGEADVLCPFEHDKGYESHPSAHVNIEKGVFHCKTCAAEGRFSDGGLSEAAFVSHLYHISYSQAIKLLGTVEEKGETLENWSGAVDALLGNQAAMDYLADRGITPDIVQEYQLGYAGAGIVYPVTMNGVLLDKRTYNYNRQPGEPKIKSERGASPAIFPFDHWQKDERPTLICAGENDTLLARKMGFNAITSTGGEGNFPAMFAGLFAGKTVYICYDCDEAGRKGQLSVAFQLHEAGAQIHLVNLGLPGTKEDKDITDFFIKHKRSAEDLQALLDSAQPYTGELHLELKNQRYPLVDLWEVAHGEYSGRRISSRVIMMGKYDMPMEVPTAIEWACDRPIQDSTICQGCRLNGKSGWWTLDDDNLDAVLRLVEVNEKEQEGAVNRLLHLPAKCPGVHKARREKKHVQKVIFAPDAETEDELSGFRATEHYAYVVGLDLEDGGRYRIYFRRYPHPKTQQIVSVVDRAEDSDSTINTFRMTPEIVQELSQFQGDPDTVMDQRYKMAQQIVGSFAPRSVVEAVNIIYHSVLDFKYAGKLMKGHPEGLVIGPSRTGKTDTAKKLQQFLGLGNLTECKTASTAGLLGGADKLPSGGHRIRWGKIPRNNRGLLILDELSGMPPEVMATLTALRSERIARLEKIVSGAAPAKTRLMWMSNPRVQSNGKSRNIALYPTGVSIVLDLIGSDEDIARFDFVVILPPTEAYISPFNSKNEIEEVKIDNTPYRNLVYWAWSRKPDQIKFAPGVEQYIWQVAQELNEKYDSDVKFFGAEANKKLARIAVAVAAMCFSHDGTGQSILITKEHVDWARHFLVRCYDNDVFRLVEYVEQQKTTMTTNEEINNLFAAMVQGQAMLMKTLSRTTEISLFQLRTVCGLNQKDFDEAISKLVQHGLLETTHNGVMPTLRFRKARDAYVNNIDRIKLTPLSQQGGLPI